MAAISLLHPTQGEEAEMVACCIRVWNLTNCCEMITMFKILNVYTTGNPGKQLEAVIPTFAMSEENGRCANVVRKKKKN